MKEPTFLLIAWPAADPEGTGTRELEAFLCRHHRNEIAATFPTARGRRGLGQSCDLCDGRGPRVAAPARDVIHGRRSCAALSGGGRRGLAPGPTT
jgi:hypothetical protein